MPTLPASGPGCEGLHPSYPRKAVRRGKLVEEPRHPLGRDGEAQPPEPDDEDEAKDALPRVGPDLGRLTLSGVRMGVNVVVRF